MKINSKNNSLTKKVLFSIVAAGVLSGFVLNAEAADEKYIYINNGSISREKVDVPWIWVERGQDKDSAKLTLTNSTITGSQFDEYPNEHDVCPDNLLSSYLIGTSYPKDSVDLEQAQVAVFVHRKGSVLSATDVNFIGEVAVNGAQGEDDIEGETKITINGGSITAGKYYYAITNSSEKRIEENATNILAYYNGQIQLNHVVINSNISAYSGGVINVNNSSVDTTKEINVAKKIYAADKGSVININFNATGTNEDSNINVTDANATDANTRGTLTVGSEIFADKGATISIENATINVTNTDSSIGATGAGSLIELKNSTINTDFLTAKTGGKLTLAKSSSATVKSISATVNESTDTIGGTIVIEGNFKTDRLSAYKNGEIYLQGGADAVYEVTGDVDVNGDGKLYIKSGRLEAVEPNGSFTISGDAKKGIFLENGGVISTISSKIYKYEASETEQYPGEIKSKTIAFDGGKLVLNDAYYTLTYAQAAAALLGDKTELTFTGEQVDENGDVQDIMRIDAIVDDKNKNLSFDQITAKTDGNLIVGSNDGSYYQEAFNGVKPTDHVLRGFAVGFLDLGHDGSNGIIITGDKEVTLGGSKGGSLIIVKGEDVGNIKVVVGTEIPAGSEPLTNGTLNIGNALATADTQYKISGEVVVNKDSNLNVEGQTEITTGLTLNEGTVDVIMGSLKTGALNVSDKSKLLGKVNADKLTLNSNSDLLLIGDNDKAGKLTVNNAKLNGGMVFLDPDWKAGTTISNASGLAVTDVSTALDGAYVAGRNSVLAFGAELTAAEEKFAKTGYTWGKGSVSAASYIAKSVDLDTKGSITVNGSWSAAPTAASAGTLALAANSLLIVDAEKTQTKAAITGVTSTDIAAGSTLFIDDAKKDNTYKILAGTASNIKDTWAEDAVKSNNSLLKFTKADVAGQYTVTASMQSISEVFGAGQVSASNAYDAALKAQNEGDAAYDFIISAADSRVNGSKAAQASALNSAAALGELAGVEHSTYAASNLLTDSVAEHMSLANKKEHNSDIWAKYIHAKENVDGLAVAGFGAKYDAQYNGIVVGADLYKQGKAAVGAALTYVDGSITGHSLVARTKNDATYYGASVYGGIQNGDSAVLGDISYLHGKHDITQYNSGKTLTADVKADAFSMGVRAEKSVKAGAGKFVPYAGLRYMHLGTGNYTNSIGMSYDGDDMNLWLLPVGVKYSAEVKTGGWTIRPLAEVGYVWNLGDRDAAQTVSLNGAGDSFGFDVTDSTSYIGRFAVEAQKANVTYGLGYEYQKGDSVKANRWMANLNWSF